MKILIIEKNAHVDKIMSAVYLSILGHKVHIASDYAQAFKAIKEGCDKTIQTNLSINKKGDLHYVDLAKENSIEKPNWDMVICNDRIVDDNNNHSINGIPVPMFLLIKAASYEIKYLFLAARWNNDNDVKNGVLRKIWDYYLNNLRDFKCSPQCRKRCNIDCEDKKTSDLFNKSHFESYNSNSSYHEFIKEFIDGLRRA